MNSELNEDTGEMNEDDDDDDDDDEEEEEPKEKDDDDDDDEGFSMLSDLPVEMSERRPTCRRCW